MPILHLKLSASDNNIIIPRTIHAQQLTLKRVIVQKYANVDDSGNTGTAKSKHSYGGGIQIFLPNLLTGYEITTNGDTQNGIVVPFVDTTFHNADSNVNGLAPPYTIAIYDSRFDMNFSQFDDIPKNLRVLIRNYDGTTACKFDYSQYYNALVKVDLFFEYNEIYEYDTY